MSWHWHPLPLLSCPGTTTKPWAVHVLTEPLPRGLLAFLSQPAGLLQACTPLKAVATQIGGALGVSFWQCQATGSRSGALGGSLWQCQATFLWAPEGNVPGDFAWLHPALGAAPEPWEGASGNFFMGSRSRCMSLFRRFEAPFARLQTPLGSRQGRWPGSPQPCLPKPVPVTL